jgi:spore germination cell wall hydrolase CwlJ-like protein
VQTVVATVAAPISARARADVVLGQLLAEHRCLAEVMYYEARGEGADGERAIAEVVFHRMRHGNYGHSICAVVYEGAGHPGCQFSFACNGELAQSKQAESWREAQILAARILTGEVTLADTTGGATNFHAVSVQPVWSGTMERTVQIGNHVFYRFTRARTL